MSAKEILEQINALPAGEQRVVYEEIERKRKETDCPALSLATAMRGMDNEVTPYSLGDLERGYAAMFADRERETEAHAWCEGFMQDVSQATRP